LHSGFVFCPFSNGFALGAGGMDKTTCAGYEKY